MDTRLDIDGSRGEGGGQILRTALSLAIIQQRPIRITGIRAGRAKPGLMRQHLTCVKAAQAISAADVDGAALGSTAIEFVPHALAGGAYHFTIGTAGSATLVLQTLLPALLCADRASRITIEGGTHNMLAPSTTFLDRCFLPQLRRMGANVRIEVEAVGLYPAGGGRMVAHVEPARMKPLRLLARGERLGVGAQALVAAVPEHVALREITRVADRYRLRREHISHQNLGARTGPGNVLSVWAEHAEVCELVTAFGERRVRAEDVADRACDELDAWLASDAVVGEHLSDQLLLPLWLAGEGEFICGAPSLHMTSNAEVINAFGGARISIAPVKDGGGLHRVSAEPGHATSGH